MYYHHWFIKRFEKNCIYRHSSRLPDSASRGVVFRLRISPQIRSPIRNGSKCSVRNLCRTDFCKNPRKSASLPCPFKGTVWRYFLLPILPWTIFPEAPENNFRVLSNFFENSRKSRCTIGINNTGGKFCHHDSWCRCLSCEYLRREFSKTGLLGYSGAWGQLIHEKEFKVGERKLHLKERNSY